MRFNPDENRINELLRFYGFQIIEAGTHRDEAISQILRLLEAMHSYSKEFVETTVVE